MNPASKRSILDNLPEPTEVFVAIRQFFSEHPLERGLCADELAARLFVLGYVNHPPFVVDVQAAQESLGGIEVVV